MSLNNSVNAIFILEIIGKPAEHLTETLGKLVESISEEKGVKIVEKKIGEAKEIEKQEGFYSNFAEIEVETEDLLSIVLLTFKYMPAHVDIVSPERISMTNNDWNTVVNELTRRLHGYDEVARILQMQNAQMQQKLKEAGVELEKK